MHETKALYDDDLLILHKDTTFLDYVRGGLKINLVVALDMTQSNGAPSNPESLHFIHPDTGENAYTTAMRTVGEILEDYDFGKKHKYTTQTNNTVGRVSKKYLGFVHFFPLSSSSLLKGILDSNQNCVQ